MLGSLYIKNYRNLQELKIDAVDQINLITGKNNTGKSTILEAIAIYANKGDLNYILQLLENRGEYSRQQESYDIVKSNIRSLSSLFTDRIVGFDTENTIRTGAIDNTVDLRFIKYIDELQKNEQIVIVKKIKILSGNKNQDKIKNYKIGFEISTNGDSFILPLEGHLVGLITFLTPDKFQFIKTTNIDSEINGKLFDVIALTEKEKYVIEALKVIEPTTEKIAFVVDENSRTRNAVIKLSATAEVLPLKSMGDGINRILTIILALVNAENGVLLIDEFENGLHHSVQERLWEIIFSLSAKLKVQVFVTTHSNDCISGFERVLNSPGNTVKGRLIRLDNVQGRIKQVEFLPEELKIANEQEIEIR
jgi:AAA15 family ATPase/GTPase